MRDSNTSRSDCYGSSIGDHCFYRSLTVQSVGVLALPDSGRRGGCCSLVLDREVGEFVPEGCHGLSWLLRMERVRAARRS